MCVCVADEEKNWHDSLAVGVWQLYSGAAVNVLLLLEFCCAACLAPT